MSATGSAPELQRIDTAGELHIAVEGADGTLRRWTSVQVVAPMAR